MGILGELLIKLGVDKSALTSGMDEAKNDVSAASREMGDSYAVGSKKMEEGAGKAEKATKSVGSTMVSAVGSTASLAAGAYALYDSYDGVQSAQIAAERATLKLSKANEAVEKAQSAYNEAVSKYGADSPQAIQASNDLAQAQEAASIAAQNAEMATGNVDDAMVGFATGGVMGVVSMISGGAGLVQTLSGLSDIHLPKLSGGISGIGKVFGSLASTLAANPLISILTAVALIAILIITNWDAVKPYFEWLWNTLCAIFQAAWNIIDQYVIKPLIQAWNWISQGAQFMYNILVAVWNAIVGALTAAWNLINQYIIQPILTAWNWIQQGAEIMRGILIGIWNTIVGALQAAWNLIDTYVIKPIVKGWDTIKAGAQFMWDGLKFIWDGITGLIKGAVDFIMGLLQPLIDTFNMVADLAGGLGDAVGAVIPDGDLIPGFHLFAEGGYVTSPTMGIFGEEEPEFLVPQSKVPSFISYIASKGSNDLGGAISTISAPVVSSSNSNQNVYVTLISSDPSAAGRALVKELGYRGVKDLITGSIAGVNVDAYTLVGSTKFSSESGSRPKGSMTLEVPPGTSYAPSKGAEIVLYDTVAAETAYGGIVYEVARDVRVDGTRAFDLTLVGYEAYADRRRAFGSLSATTSGAVVSWLLSTYLAEYGITAGTIEAGSTVANIRYTGQTVTEALNELAKIDGYTWYIDVSKRLHYISRESYTAPFDLTDSYFPVLSFKTIDTLDGYRNRQWFRGSANSISDSQSETFTGDGALVEFTLRYKARSSVSIKVNGVSKTVGIRGLDSGKDWYWKEGEDIISQDSAGTVLTASDTLIVTYIGTYPLALVLESSAEIAVRAGAEGNSGIYEALDEDTSCQYLDMAMDKAETLMRQNPWTKANVSYTTDVPGLRAGMVQTIARTDYGINTTFLITSVEANELLADGFPMRYTVSGVSGERADDWLDFYRMLSARSKYEVREGEVITQAGKIEATCVLGSSVTYITKPSAKWNDGSKWDGGAAWW